MDFVCEGQVLKKYTGNNLKVIIPNDIITIDESAFKNSNIEEIIFNDILEEINDYAFKDCNLKKVVFPKTLKKIGKFSFACNKNLKSVILNETLQIIDEYAFLDCAALKKISLPNIKIIRKGTFYDCKNLKRVYSKNIEQIDEYAFYNCKSLSQFIDLGNVNSIKMNAFSFCAFKKLDLENVGIIGDNTFSNNNLLKCITIGSTLHTIGVGSFSNCKALLRFIVSDKNAFFTSKNDSLYNKSMNYFIAYPIGKKDILFTDNTVTKVYDYAFFNARNLTAIEMKSLKDIGIDSFSNCVNLKKVSNNIKIKYESFVGCKYLTMDNVD